MDPDEFYDLKQRAESGDAEAQLAFGDCYADGKPVATPSK